MQSNTFEVSLSRFRYRFLIVSRIHNQLEILTVVKNAIILKNEIVVKNEIIIKNEIKIVKINKTINNKKKLQ